MNISTQIAAVQAADKGSQVREPVASAIEAFDGADLIKEIRPTVGSATSRTTVAIEDADSYDTQCNLDPVSVAAGSTIAGSKDISYSETITDVYGYLIACIEKSSGDNEYKAIIPTVSSGKVHFEYNFGTASEDAVVTVSGRFYAVKG